MALCSCLSILQLNAVLVVDTFVVAVCVLSSLLAPLVLWFVNKLTELSSTYLVD